jgi:uncharacterized protein (TIGR03067 family)
MARTPRTRSVPTQAIEDPTHLEDLWDEPAPSPHIIRPDAEALQGAWKSVTGRRQAEFLISGNRFTIHFGDGDIYMGSFTLGKNGRTRTMDVRVEEGPNRHRGLIALCIYELDGDMMRWCTASPGQADRPLAFAEHDPQHLFLVFRREHQLGKR